MDNKIYKIAITLVAVLLIASGCGKQGNDAMNNTAGVGNEDGTVIEQQPETEEDTGTDEAVDSDEPTEDVTVADIIDQIMAEVEFGAMMTLDDEQVKDLYGIDPAEYVEEGIFKPAMMNVHAYELAVVKLKSDEAYEAIEAAMLQRAESIQKTFEMYLPNQYEASQNYQIIRNGDYVLFSITPDQEKTADVFDSFFTP